MIIIIIFAGPSVALLLEYLILSSPPLNLHGVRKERERRRERERERRSHINLYVCSVIS